MKGEGSNAVYLVVPVVFGFQLYVLLSSYLCLSPFYILIGTIYILGDDSTSIRKGSFIRTKYLCVLIHFRTTVGEAGTVKHV